VFFAAYTGCRRGKVLALRWQDVNFDDSTVTISRSLTERLEFKTPKNDKSKTLTMPQALVAALKTHRAGQAKGRLFLGPAYKDQSLVLAHADGSPIAPWNFGRAVRDLMLRTGITGTLHSLRDTHASLLAKAGVPIEVVSKRLGHSSIGVTCERYLDVYTDRDAAAATAFERLVG
jgi:integrase